MGSLRRYLLAHRLLAALLLALTLCIKLTVPAGFMIKSQGTELVVAICGDGGGQTAKIVIPGPGGNHQDDSQTAKAKGSCPFAGHGSPLLAGADPLVLALALAFILALGFAARPVPALQALNHLRPPLRGPPALA